MNKPSVAELSHRHDEITHIVSHEQECVQLSTSIFPHEYEGRVEEWLRLLEVHMRASVAKVIADGLRDYTHMTKHMGMGNEMMRVSPSKRSKNSKGLDSFKQWLSNW